ncbi:MAG: hypothetical protein L6R36_008475 [Xanthoria steineri]|nr:MAG: hypothetical protein L6R36_008475 [Xanthoria steineri]
MVLGNHVEKLFLYVTGLNQYPIILGLPWLRRHEIDANFGSNTLTMSSSHCLKHCTQKESRVPRRVKDTIRLQEATQFPDAQKALTQSAIPVGTQSVIPDDIQIAIPVGTQSVIPDDIQIAIPVGAQSVIPDDTPSRIDQAMQKGYQPKIKYRSPSSRRSSTERRVQQARRPPIQLDVVELGARNFDRAARQNGSELFSLTLHQIDDFLGIQSVQAERAEAQPENARSALKFQMPNLLRPLRLDPDGSSRPRTYAYNLHRSF